MTERLLDPWLRGPFHLIEHANGHLTLGGDPDRIIALIGFDQAVEVCADVFINLHPRLRGNYPIKREDAAKALINFHTKLEFIENYASEHGITDLPGNQVVWFHTLRNELYHSGNGMVPELHVLEGARAAAITVFKALFKVDISSSLGLESAQVAEAAHEIPAVSSDLRMDLLRLVQEAETALRNTLEAEGTKLGGRAGLGPLLQRYFEAHPEAKTIVSPEAVATLLQVRNRIAHGQPVSEDEAAEIAPVATQLAELGFKQLQDVVASARSALDLVEPYVGNTITDLLVQTGAAIRIRIITNQLQESSRTALRDLLPSHPHLEVRQGPDGLHVKQLSIDGIAYISSGVRDIHDGTARASPVPSAQAEELRESFERWWASAEPLSLD